MPPYSSLLLAVFPKWFFQIKSWCLLSVCIIYAVKSRLSFLSSGISSTHYLSNFEWDSEWALACHIESAFNGIVWISIPLCDQQVIVMPEILLNNVKEEVLILTLTNKPKLLWLSNGILGYKYNFRHILTILEGKYVVDFFSDDSCAIRLHNRWLSPPVSCGIPDSNGHVSLRTHPNFVRYPWLITIYALNYGCPSGEVLNTHK